MRPIISQGCRKSRDDSRTCMCHVYSTDRGPGSGFCPYFLNTQSPAWQFKKDQSLLPQLSHLIMLVVLLLAGRVITKQPRRILASSGKEISKLGCYLGFQIWKKVGKHFLLMFHQLKSAAGILQNAIFRSKGGGNRQRIKKKKKGNWEVSLRSPSGAALCMDFRPQGL